MELTVALETSKAAALFTDRAPTKLLLTNLVIEFEVLLKLIGANPTNTKELAEVVMTPETVICPEVPPINALLPSETGPINTPVVKELLVSAPPLLIPEPFSVNEFALVMVMPFRSNTAPLVTETVPELAPKAVALPTLSVPALIVVPPL